MTKTKRYFHTVLSCLAFYMAKSPLAAAPYPFTQAAGECFQEPLWQYFSLLFSCNCSCAVIPMALYLQTPTVLLWLFSREVVLTGHFFLPLFSSPFIVALGLHLGKQCMRAESLKAKQHAAPSADLSVLQSVLTASYVGTISWEFEWVLKKTT